VPEGYETKCASESPVIVLEDLHKHFKDVKAVDGISFEICEGEIFGLLGPNGAGKTTTISMLCTLLKPTAGQAFVCGYDIRKEKDEVRKSIGIVFQDPSLDDQLTGYENLDFHGRLYSIPKSERAAKIEELLALVELSDKKNILVENYSGGMKRRLEIARGLMHRPKVLFLDEPTLGLDPQTRRHIWNYVKDLNKTAEVTIILTTHYMDEADILCDRVAIIDKGKICATDTPANLKKVIGGDIISIKTGDDFSLEEEWVRNVSKLDGTIQLTVHEAETKVPLLMRLAQKQGVDVSSITIHNPTLEDVFLYYTGSTIREEEGSWAEQVRMRRRTR
jgi:ABC-2 type transport system ATP-binding protein